MTTRSWNTIASSAAALALLAGSAAAQPPTNPPRPGDQPARQPDRKPEAPKPPDKNLEKDTTKDRMSAKTVILVPTASTIGKDVIGSTRDKIGDINDLIISRADGKVTYALVGHGGVLGIGEKVIAVPYSAFGWDAEKKALTLPLTKERLKDAPSLDRGEWKTLSDPVRSEASCTYFNAQKNVVDPHDTAFRSEYKSALPPDQLPIMRATDIKGKKLVGDDGRDTGKIDEIVYDADSGRIAFAVVTFGGVAGLGDDKVAVPWSMLDINRDGNMVAMNLDKEMVRSAPRLTSRDWAELRDADFGPRVYKHFNRRADWLAGTGERAERTDRAVPGERRDLAMSDYDRLFVDGKDYQLSGVVQTVDTICPMPGTPDVVCITVKNEKGDATAVHLAPKHYIDSQNVVLKDGDNITVRGRLVEHQGKKFVIASEITPSSGRELTLRGDDGTCLWKR